MLSRLLGAGMALYAGLLISGCTSCCHNRPVAVPPPPGQPAFVGSAPIGNPGCATCAPGAAPTPPVPPAPAPVPSFYPQGTFAPRY